MSIAATTWWPKSPCSPPRASSGAIFRSAPSTPPPSWSSACSGWDLKRYKQREMAGKFITIEGGEGTGKSTQADLLAKKLSGMGIGVLLTREPGGSPGAEIIRHVLLSGAAKPLGPNAEALLFAAARADHLNTLIKPALRSGRWVVCDRFIDSTRVYQGIVGSVGRPFVKGVEKLTVGATEPSLTFILDLPAEIGLERARARRADAAADRFETEDLAYHQ